MTENNALIDQMDVQSTNNSIIDCSKTSGRFVSAATSNSTTEINIHSLKTQPSMIGQWRPIKPSTERPNTDASLINGNIVKRRYNRKPVKPSFKSDAADAARTLVHANQLSRFPQTIPFNCDPNYHQRPQQMINLTKPRDIVTSAAMQSVISPGQPQLVFRTANQPIQNMQSPSFQRPPVALNCSPQLFQCANGASFQLVPVGTPPFQFLNCPTSSQLVLTHNFEDIMQASMNANTSRAASVSNSHSPTHFVQEAACSLPNTKCLTEDLSSNCRNSTNSQTEAIIEEVSKKPRQNSEQSIEQNCIISKNSDIPSQSNDTSLSESDDVVTHVVDGYVIKESSTPFPVVQYCLPTKKEALSTKRKEKATDKRKTIRQQIKRDKTKCSDEKESKKSEKGGNLKAKRSRRSSPSPIGLSIPDIQRHNKTQSDDPELWTIDEVSGFILERTNNCELAEKFRSHEVDGSALLLVKEEFLMQFMDMKLGPALKLCSRIADLRKRSLLSNAATNSAVF